METDRADPPTILIVDDVPENLTLLTHLLKGRYRVLASTTGQRALTIARRKPCPDLILLDVVMADLDGFEVCRRLKADDKTSEVPVIFVTAQSDVENERAGLELGAVDYIHKPFSPALVLARVQTHLQSKAARDFLRDQNAFLEQEVARRTKEIERIQDVTMVAFGSLAETRDNETGAHIRRTQGYMRLLAAKARAAGLFANELTDSMIGLLGKSAPLHDIGKVGIPDHILLKPGRLTAQEFEVMKTHTTLGTLAIQKAEQHLGTPASFLALARAIAWTHHERWDGTGYPQGLGGDAIPLAGRLMAVSDVYDALRTERVYKPAFPHEKTVDLMVRGSRGHFDPRLIQLFQDSSSDWADIYEEHGP